MRELGLWRAIVNNMTTMELVQDVVDSAASWNFLTAVERI